MMAYIDKAETCSVNFALEQAISTVSLTSALDGVSG